MHSASLVLHIRGVWKLTTRNETKPIDSTAYRAGVTTGIVSPQSDGFLSGVSAAFSLAAPHKLAEGAIVQRSGAVHVAIHRGEAQSVSTQVAALRRLLVGSNQTDGELRAWFARIGKGEATLVVEAESADVIATIIELKQEVEETLKVADGGKKLKVTIAGGREAHLLARELGEAGVGVLLTQPRPFPKEWEAHRM